jgi:hypothetical protein
MLLTSCKSLPKGIRNNFTDYILKNYVASNSKFPPNPWAQLPSLDSKRTTNAAESFHPHYNEQFSAAHPTIFCVPEIS